MTDCELFGVALAKATPYVTHCLSSARVTGTMQAVCCVRDYDKRYMVTRARGVQMSGRV